MADELTSPVELDALTVSVRWRWGIVCAGTLLLTVSHSLQISNLSPWIIASFATIGAAANLLLVRLLQSGWYRPFLIFAYCLFDLCLIGLAIVYLGPGGTSAALVVVIVPCAQRTGKALGTFSLCAASVIFIAATILHGRLSGPTYGQVGSISMTVLDLAVIMSVAATLLVAHSNLLRRIAQLGKTLGNASEGYFTQHDCIVRTDIVGSAEQSLNRLLAQIASLLEAVGRETSEIGSLGATSAHSTGSALQTSRSVLSAADRLSSDLQDFRSSAWAEEAKCQASMLDVQQMQSRAEESLRQVRELLETAQIGREMISTTIETMIAAGKDIESTVNIVEELSALSRQIGSSAITIAKIARHTHILALNAAIEAARAKEHGQEFAVVADQVRTLAGEAGKSARDVGALVSDVDAAIAGAASAMAAGHEKINDVGQTAGEAKAALARIHAAATDAAEFMTATAESYQSQHAVVRSFSDALSRSTGATDRCTTALQHTASDVTEQMRLLDDVALQCHRITKTAEHVMKDVARFYGTSD